MGFSRQEYVPFIPPSNCSAGHSSPRNEDLCSNRNLHMNVYSSFFLNCLKLKTNQITLNCWIKWAHLNCGLPLTNKKEQTIDTCSNLYEPPENYTKWKSEFQKFMYCITLFIYNSWKGKLSRNEKQISGCQELRRGMEIMPNIKGQHIQSHSDVSALYLDYQCEYSGCDTAAVLQDITIYRNRVKCVQDPSLYCILYTYMLYI